MFNPKIVENFLEESSCQYLIDVASTSNLWESGGSEFWNNRVINFYTMLQHDAHASEIMLDVNARCGKKIKELYGLENSVYPDTLQIIRWFPGMEQPPHSDDMSDTDIVGFDHRAFGSILYLNDNYQGGHTYYKKHYVEIVPKVGKLAIHPGNPEHLHGVTKIYNETRYTIASFWTFDKEKSHEWSIH